MIIIVGCIVVVGAVLGGFTWAGGHVGALIHPSEMLTIGGAALGSMIVMSPKKVLIDLCKGLIACLKGSPYTKANYDELFKLLYDLLRTARRDGLLALDSHVNDPHGSSIINKYPKLAKDHHAIGFLCGSLSPVIDGSVPAEDLQKLLDIELKAMEEEHHAPSGILAKTADALPGFGIVAAVLGIVITMGHIDGPVHEIGHKVGAALVGTFLGILLSYGFVAPMAVRMEFLSATEMSFMKTISTVIVAFAGGALPKVALEQARRGLNSEVRPTRERLEEIFQEVDAT